ncbi:MAG: TrkH family potassium uptake protein, partial [Desulfobacterales bacterium]
MRWRYILHTVGVMSFFFGLTMIIPLIVGLYYRDQSVAPMLKSLGITVFSGLALHFIFRSGKAEVISQR